MAIELIPLDQIDDSPFQCRRHYSTKALDELSASISEHGLRQKPEARRKDGRVQLAYGHMRFRAFKKLARTQPAKWEEMPLDIQEISDEDMFYYSLEENMRRANVTPLEIAQSVEVYLTQFPDQTETQLSKRLKMTQGHISNMRRVLRLPEKVREKIDEGKINFTMGRELLIFQGKNVGQYQEWRKGTAEILQKDEKYLMLAAIRQIGGNYGIPATVDGIKKTIHNVAKENFRALDSDEVWEQRKPLFDTKANNCLKCEHTVVTHPTKTSSAHWCTDLICWDQKQEAHQEQAATKAREKMQADVLAKIVDNEGSRQEGAPISQEIPDPGEHNEALIVEEANAIVGAAKEETIRDFEQRPDFAACEKCNNLPGCDGDNIYPSEDGKTLFCDDYLDKMGGQPQRVSDVIHDEKAENKAVVEIPEHLRGMIAEKAGTRAEILDLHTLLLSSWGEALRQGYVLLDTDVLLDPDECLDRCTTGFHYAFNSRKSTGEVYCVCTNTKCLSKKKGALTREHNAAGQNKKQGELAAIKQAVQATTVIDVQRIKLIFLAQCQGAHVQRHYWGQDGISPVQWLQKELPLELPPGKSFTAGILSDKLDSMTQEAAAQLLVKFMFEVLLYRGEVVKYKIETTEALNWMGVGVQVEKKKATSTKNKAVSK